MAVFASANCNFPLLLCGCENEDPMVFAALIVVLEALRVIVTLQIKKVLIAVARGLLNHHHLRDVVFHKS